MTDIEFVKTLEGKVLGFLAILPGLVPGMALLWKLGALEFGQK